jgi:hypothetical protein
MSMSAPFVKQLPRSPGTATRKGNGQLSFPYQSGWPPSYHTEDWEAVSGRTPQPLQIPPGTAQGHIAQTQVHTSHMGPC